MDEQYIDVIPVQCTLPNNFQLCNAFENGLCFSGCGTCNTKNTEQQVRPDKPTKCVFPDNYIICGAYDGNGNCKSPKGTCRST